MPLSHACELGQHEDCGGKGDMLGCSCNCHLEPDDGPELVDWPSDAELDRAYQIEQAELNSRNER
jgi:hypothetical protein